jgi:hypothetical protein
METDLRRRAERIAIDRLRTLRPAAGFLDGSPGYLADWLDNLIDGVTPADFDEDLRRGDGGELTDRPGTPAKFRAAFSSSALAVNTFGPFRHRPARLSLAGVTGFRDVEFEYACGNGLVGTNPHFDLFAQTEATVVALESKFLEPLRPRMATFSDQYRQSFRGTAATPALVEPPWARMYSRLREDPEAYRYLDAAQLAKHYLGLVFSFANRQRTLVYLYWEPTNAASLGPYRDHRREVNDFATSVAGCETRFVALSYLALWREWDHNRSSFDLSAHIDRLRQRYEFSL